MTEAVTRRTPGTPCWVSLMVHSLAATQDFYSTLFGWTFAPGPAQLGPYVRGLLQGREVAGVGELPAGRHLPVAWTTYLASDDADATAEQIRACGGTVAVGPLSAGEAGRLVIAADPGGAVFGVWQGHEHIGARALGEPGAQTWNELLTPDVSVVKFYETVFGYEAEEQGEDRIALYLEGRPVAAARVPHDDRGPRWMTYFGAADTDEATRRVVELGGRVVEGPRDVPGGRAATVACPEGAVFSLLRTAR